MMRFGALVLGLTLLFSVLLGLLTAIERLAPPTATMIIDVDGSRHSPPCWYGVCPGQSTVGDAEKIFAKNDSTLVGAIQPDLPDYDGRPPTVHNLCADILAVKGWQACFYQRTDSGLNSKFVEPITLWSDGNALRLGDVMSVLGPPDSVLVCRAYDFSLAYEEWTAQFIFNGNTQVIARAEGQDGRLPPDPKYFSPQMSVKSIAYSAHRWSDEPGQGISAHWSGFTLKNQTSDLDC